MWLVCFTLLLLTSPAKKKAPACSAGRRNNSVATTLVCVTEIRACAVFNANRLLLAQSWLIVSELASSVTQVGNGDRSGDVIKRDVKMKFERCRA